jgi:hypothetical protein
MVALAPGVMGMYYMGRKSWAWFFCMIALLVFGVLATVLQVLYTDPDLAHVKANCRWEVPMAT